MVSPRVSKALNPQKRRFSLKQIAAGFGGKRRRASLKATRHTHKRKAKAKAANPRKHKRRATAKRKNSTKARTIYRTKTVVKKVYVKAKRKANPKRQSKKRRSPNPPLLLTAWPVGNPQKRRKKPVARKAKRKATAKGRSGKARRNPTRRTHHRRGRGPARHRNPGISSTVVKTVVGAAVGFSIGKKVPPLLGAQANSSVLMSLLTTAVTGIAATWAAKKFAPAFADGVMIGGGMATLNVALNAWAPPQILQYSALGDFAPATQPWLFPRGPVGYVSDGGGMAMPVADGAQVNMGAWSPAW